MSHKPYQFAEGSMSNPGRYQSAEAQAILKIGCDNPIVFHCLMAWERDECTWEQALVAMVTELNKTNLELYRLLVRAKERQQPSIVLQSPNEPPRLLEPIVRPRTEGR